MNMNDTFDSKSFNDLMNADLINATMSGGMNTPANQQLSLNVENVRPVKRNNTDTQTPRTKSNNPSHSNSNIHKLNVKTEEPKVKISPAVQELLNRRKQLLNKLWEDIDENWAHRETFLHNAFSSPYENYNLISNETLRVFEIRWLDLRILGMIDQRETILLRIQDISEKRNPRDLKKNQQLVEEDLQIYRTITLYITEYIQTWIRKNPEKSTYLWKGKDYLIKMNSDFTKVVRKSKRLQSILEEMKLSATPLCLPTNPTPYLKHSKLSDERKDEDTSSEPEYPSLTSHSSHTPGDWRPSSGTDFNSRPPSRTPSLHLDGSLNSPVPHRHFGKVIKFQKRVFDNEKDHVFMTSLDVDKLKSPETRGSTIREKEHGDNNPDDKEQQMKPPPLLIEQNFKDRKKRHKKYSEPLCSIRHEDLMDKLQEEQPFYFNDLIQKKREKLAEAGKANAAAIAASHIGYVQQILVKSNQYLKKMQENRNNLEIPKSLAVEPTIPVDPRDELEDADVQFPDANLADDICRLQRAHQFIQYHTSRSPSRFSATPGSSGVSTPNPSLTTRTSSSDRLNK